MSEKCQFRQLKWLRQLAEAQMPNKFTSWLDCKIYPFHAMISGKIRLRNLVISSFKASLRFFNLCNFS
jgi:hypothetical protein